MHDLKRILFLVALTSLAAAPAWSIPYVFLYEVASVSGSDQTYDSGFVPGPTLSNTISNTGVGIAAIATGSVGYGVAHGSAYALAKHATVAAGVVASWFDEITFVGPASTVPVTFTLSLSASATAVGELCGPCASVIERLSLDTNTIGEIRIDNLTPGPIVKQFTVTLPTNFAWGITGRVIGNASAAASIFDDLVRSAEVDYSNTALLMVDVPAGFSYNASSGTVYPSAVPEPTPLALSSIGFACLVALRRRRLVGGCGCIGWRPWAGFATGSPRPTPRSPSEGRAELILTECGAAAAAETRTWLAERPRFELHVAPRGQLWTELIGHWFRPGNASDPRLGFPQLARNRVSAPYDWTSRGREMFETSIRSISR